MKRILTFFIFILLAMGPGAAGAQTVVMDEGHVAFDYPDSWLVVSPQLCGVYAPLLEDAGFDADELARELEQTRTLSRAYNENYTQYLSVLIGEDELSQEIYEIENATDSQRATLRRRVEANSFWETTGLRTPGHTVAEGRRRFLALRALHRHAGGRNGGARIALHHRSQRAVCGDGLANLERALLRAGI